MQTMTDLRGNNWFKKRKVKVRRSHGKILHNYDDTLQTLARVTNKNLLCADPVMRMHKRRSMHRHLGYEGPELGASLGQGADPTRRDHVAPRDVDARQLTNSVKDYK